MEALCLGQMSMVWASWQRQPRVGTLRLWAPCPVELPSSPSQVYLITNPHDLRERMKNKMCSLFRDAPLPTIPDVKTKEI